MNRHYIPGIILVAIILILIGAGVLIYGLAQGETLFGLGAKRATPSPVSSTFEIPTIEIAPPPSLSELAEEVRPEYPALAELLENPELGSVYKDFYLAFQRGGQETALALARQRGILNDDDEIIMTLVLDTEETTDLIVELEAEGVIITENFRNLINIAVPVSLIQEQLKGEDSDLIIDRVSNLEHVIRVEFPNKATIKQGRTILGQGVNKTLADTWHSQGMTGQGVKVGILDLGFGGYQDLLGTELPLKVTTEIFGEDTNFDTEVHGTACAEIIHEMAPDAELYLAYFDGTDAAMGVAVSWLMDQGVDIINNSTGSNGLTPMNGTGFAAELVDEVHASGILWVNAAGNEATNHYRGKFSDADGDNLHEFFPDTETIPFIPFGPGYQTSIILSWNDWEVVDQDYELILYDDEGNVLAKSEDPQSGEPGNIPVEGFLYEFDDTEVYHLSIENYDGLAREDATLDLFITEGDMHPDFLVAEASLSSPADARGAFVVGAVHWADDILEPYSSNGPTADGRIKPDISAPSVVDSASYAPEAFDGTSAAAPHVAGAAALILQAFPELSQNPDESAKFLQERSIDLGPPGPDTAFGVGRLNLGPVPADAGEAETPRPADRQSQPTSTPRPSGTAVGLPGKAAAVSAQAEVDDFGGQMVLLGLCVMCLGGVLLIVFILAVIIRGRRK